MAIKTYRDNYIKAMEILSKFQPILFKAYELGLVKRIDYAYPIKSSNISGQARNPISFKNMSRDSLNKIYYIYGIETTNINQYKVCIELPYAYLDDPDKYFTYLRLKKDSIRKDI